MSENVHIADIKSTFNGAKTGNPFFDYFFRPLSFYCTIPFARANVTPNQASFLGLVIGMIGLVFWCLGSWTGWIVGTLFMLLHLLFDFIDGNLARYYDKATYIGKFLDSFFDKVVGVCTPIAIVIGLINFDYSAASSASGLTPLKLALLVGFTTTLWMLERESYSRYQLLLMTIEEYNNAFVHSLDHKGIFKRAKQEETKHIFVKTTASLLRLLKKIRSMLLHGVVFLMIPFGLAEWFLIFFTLVSIASSVLEITSMLYKGFAELNVHRRSASHCRK